MIVIVVYPTLPGNVSELVRISVPPVFATIRLDSQSVSQSVSQLVRIKHEVKFTHTNF